MIIVRRENTTEQKKVSKHDVRKMKKKELKTNYDEIEIKREREREMAISEHDCYRTLTANKLVIKMEYSKRHKREREREREKTLANLA